MAREGGRGGGISNPLSRLRTWAARRRKKSPVFYFLFLQFKGQVIIMEGNKYSPCLERYFHRLALLHNDKANNDTCSF